MLEDPIGPKYFAELRLCSLQPRRDGLSLDQQLRWVFEQSSKHLLHPCPVDGRLLLPFEPFLLGFAQSRYTFTVTRIESLWECP